MKAFLSERKDLFKGFLACPITGHIDPTTGLVTQDHQQLIQGMYRVLRSVCEETFLALEREAWGKEIMTGEECVPLDFQEMRRCDVVVALPGQSHGVAVELGWASALGKPIILLAGEGERYSPVIEGLPQIASLERLTLPAGSWAARLAAVSAPLKSCLQAARQRWASAAPALERQSG